MDVLARSQEKIKYRMGAAVGSCWFYPGVSSKHISVDVSSHPGSKSHMWHFVQVGQHVSREV